MAEPTSEKHYEEKFEFPLWKLIKGRAEEKDISYLKAAEEVVPEYEKTIRYRDTEFEEAAVKKRAKEMMEVFSREHTESNKKSKEVHR
ncbi:hypothetical protein [Clostridium aminobutyricum]|uniref:Uncharacterized protein n=1 Tax=Clostridium aminobutyricum TaxID=33953 RepID=A0A939D9A4_CLOAM|nr:hypothetical protein [Clostridium aminobutyricum]MBN7773526.1 hypothetical protein [Clostridium aminobutyricum]